MDDSLVLQIFRDLSREGSEVASDVGMGEHDSFRLGGRAGGENNLKRIGGINRKRSKALRGMLSDGGGQIGGIEGGESFEMRGAIARAENELRADLLADAARKVGAGSVVDRNGENSRDSAAQERGDPLGRVRAPEKDRVAL